MGKDTGANRKIYISGAIAGFDIEERRAAFTAASEKLKNKGFITVNPFENGLSLHDHWVQHMRTDLKNLLECNCIYMLNGWQQSRGAKLELDVASSCGLEVLFEK